MFASCSCLLKSLWTLPSASSLKPRKARHFPKAGAVPSVFSFRPHVSPSESAKHVDALRESVMFFLPPPSSLGNWAKWWRHSLLEAGRKQGEEVATQAKFVPGGFFFQVALGRAPAVYTQCVCRVTIEINLAFMQEARLSWTAIDCALLFFSVLFQTSDAPTWVSRIQIQTRTIALVTETGATQCVLWEVTMYGLLPFKKLGFLAVQLWPIFLLKYSLRRAMLQLEFRWSKPDESHSEQSKTETRKTAFCSSETLKSHAGDGPAAAGCPVSNPDNNCANGLFKNVNLF